MEVSRLIQSTDQREDALDKLMELIRQVIPYQNGTLFVLNRASKQLVVGTVLGDHVDLIGGVAFDHGFGFSSWVAKQQKPILLNELHRTSRSIGPDIGSFLSVPLVVQQELVGVLNLSHPSNQAFTEEHLRLLTLIASQAAAILQRILMYEEMSRLAITDELTGLYNRRHFNEILGHAFAEATRYESDLTCMMIDLDNFKRVNDSLGHQAGDHLLQLTAQAIRSSIRESDIAVRYGGDEFAVLLPRTSPSDARASAERMLENFRSTIAQQMPEASIASLSIGLASRANAEPTTANEILILADEALYLAKAGGKNRITMVRTPALSGGG